MDNVVAEQRPRHSPTGRAPDPEIASTLNALLKECRLRRSLDQAWEAARAGGVKLAVSSLDDLRPRQRGPLRGLTQQNMAQLLGVSSRQYQNWERGTSPIPRDTVRSIAIVLGMHADEFTLLSRLTLGHDPEPVTALPGAEQVHWLWQCMVHGLPYPAYISDFSWNQLVVNRAFHEAMPWAAPGSERPESNAMRLALFHPMAPAHMCDWEQEWARPMFDQLWSAYQLHRENRELAALAAQVSQAPHLRRVWTRRARRPTVHQDTDIRLLRHPLWGRIRVGILAAAPSRAPGCRFVALLPLDGPEAVRLEDVGGITDRLRASADHPLPPV
ncbi:hypothetical protein GCM10027168_45550 [Streptomyces capparidis]